MVIFKRFIGFVYKGLFVSQKDEQTSRQTKKAQHYYCQISKNKNVNIFKPIKGEQNC